MKPSKQHAKGKLAQSLRNVQRDQKVRDEKKRRQAIQENQLNPKKRKSSQQSFRPTIPFNASETILLVGEADFSFTLSLLRLKKVNPYKVVATSYDSKETCFEKYPNASNIVQQLEAEGVKVAFNVDATQLSTSKIVQANGPYHKVVFNFPHVGQGIKDKVRNIRANQELLLLFFRSVAPYLAKGNSNSEFTGGSKKKKNKSESEDDVSDPSDDDDIDYIEESHLSSRNKGLVLITLRTHPPYSEWLLPQLAKKGDLMVQSILKGPLSRQPQPLYNLITSFRFVPEAYPGYEHKRTIGHTSVNPLDNLYLPAKERKTTSKANEKSPAAESTYADSLRMYEFELKN